MPRPLVLLTVVLIAGIITGYYTTIPNLPLLVVLAVVFLMLLIATEKKSQNSIFSLSLFAMAILGILTINISIHSAPGSRHIVHQISEEKLTVEGIINDTPEDLPEGQTIIVTVRNMIENNHAIPVEGMVILSVRIDYPLNYGDLIRFRSRLRKPHNFNNPGSFDYEKHLRGRGILVRGTINSSSDIILIRKDCGNPFRSRLEKVRDTLRRIIAENSTTPQREIIQALLLGETKQIPLVVKEHFNRTGTSHILAISGLNVGIVAACSIFFTMLIMRASPYLLLRFNAIRVSTFAALIPILIYALIAGMGISVIRATIMILVFLAAVLLQKERDLFNVLALAALLILLLSPTSLFDISFQLSFAAVASLIFTAPLFASLFPEQKKSPWQNRR